MDLSNIGGLGQRVTAPSPLLTSVDCALATASETHRQTDVPPVNQHLQ